MDCNSHYSYAIFLYCKIRYSDPVNFVDPSGLMCEKEKKRLKDITKKSDRISRKLKAKAAKSAGRKAAAVAAAALDGPIPAGDIVAVGILLYDIYDMWGSGDELKNIIEELEEAQEALKECTDKSKSTSTGGVKVVEGKGVKELENNKKKGNSSKKANQLKKNRQQGKRRENEVKHELEKEGHEVLGSEVTVKTPKTNRRIDHLIKDGKTREIRAIEVKSGGATRNATQIAKDKAMESQGAKIIGKNAPNDLKGKTIKIPTEVRN